MKLKDDFYKVTKFCKTATGNDYIVEMNPEHAIFQVHFPNNPITPGVCILQIVKELSEKILNHELFLKKANNIKFLKVIDPLKVKEVTFSISVTSEGETEHKVSAVVHDKENLFSKLSITFVYQ